MQMQLTCCDHQIQPVINETPLNHKVKREMVSFILIRNNYWNGSYRLLRGSMMKAARTMVNEMNFDDWEPYLQGHCYATACTSSYVGGLGGVGHSPT